MREALSVWNPFADELLAHWLETMVDGRVAAHYPEGWRKRGRALLDRYDDLALTFTRTTKHRRRKENLAIMRIALTEAVHRPLSARWRGLLQHAVDSMLAKRGAPGSPTHAELRAQQDRVLDQPTHHALARVVVQRLAVLPPEIGIESTDALLKPTEDGTPIPHSIRAVVERALAATPETLIERGVVPSAVAAVARWRGPNAGAREALVRLGELALDAFPATPLPNPLIAELDTLAREAQLGLPFTEELAADIFMGRFSPKFAKAARLAGELLEGTPYAERYAIDYAALDGDFDELCIARAGTRPGDVPENRRIIEQAQILTTHNLATLVRAGVTVDAKRAAARCREARTTKPWVAARIERQRIFFESLIGK